MAPHRPTSITHAEGTSAQPQSPGWARPEKDDGPLPGPVARSSNPESYAAAVTFAA